MSLFFSLVMPTLNSAGTVAAAIESVLRQKFPFFELIVVDGGSDDNTVAIASSYHDSRITVLSEPDRGVFDAMNKGVRVSTGEWLFFLGSDDTLASDTVLSTMEMHICRLPGVHFFYGDVEVIRAGETSGEIYDGPFDLVKLLKRNISHQAIFYHRRLFDELGAFNLRYTVVADYDFNLRVAARYAMHYTGVLVSRFSLSGLSSMRKDEVFLNDFPDVIIRTFITQLSRRIFGFLEFYIRRNAVGELRRGRILAGLSLLAVGWQHRVVNYLEKKRENGDRDNPVDPRKRQDDPIDYL